ncbi:MAG: acetyl-CoA acetyltransferase [Actinomycetia bacterium]|nr:acetyl-CoA acetyltransferase [Actinomycetes bacterium]
MRDVAVISFAASAVERDDLQNEVEMLTPVIHEAVGNSGIERTEIGFTCSGSLDYMQGGPFAFVLGLDAVGAWPPIRESHVEADAAWALYEAWVAIQIGEVDSALVYGFGKSSSSDIYEVMSMQYDPYYMLPLWPSMIDVAALQARDYMESSGRTERDFAEVASRSLGNAKSTPYAISARDASVEELLGAPMVNDPLRAHDIFKPCDGAAAVVLAAGDLARSVCARPAWIRGIDHRIEPHALGVRDLSISVSTKDAAQRAGAGKDKIDVAELHAQFSSEELILRDAIGVNGNTRVNPSGGALAANPIMAAGLIRIGEVAKRITAGEADRGLAHATSGPCMQQNLVCVLEGE